MSVVYDEQSRIFVSNRLVCCSVISPRGQGGGGGGNSHVERTEVLVGNFEMNPL